MKRVGILIAIAVLFSTISAWAQCPAHVVAEHGHSAFETFHDVMSPAWHGAYPEKDYDALLAAGPKFKEAFLEIQAMRPELKSEIKKTHFNECRKEFATLVDQYAAACAEGNTEKVYELMPDLHTAFERTAATLVPISYKEFDALKITLGLIANEHVPANNQEGIIGSTETLVTKAASLNGETLPHMLMWSKDDILKRFETIQTLTVKMKECCDRDDMTGYADHMSALNAEITEFGERYL